MIVSRESARCSRAVIVAIVAALPAFGLVADDKADAIKADRTLLAGEWRVVSIEANGNTNADPVRSRVTVVNELDGRWSLLAEGKTIAEGTSTIDPTTHPKTIELKGVRGSIENARGRHYRGIYEVHEKNRRLCFVPAGNPLPESFSGARETGQILVTFERVEFE